MDEMDLAERLARVEERQVTQGTDIAEMKNDMKAVRSYIDRQKGQATILGALLTALIGVGSWIGGSHLGR